MAGCFKLTSCDHNSANQNIHAYGVMLFVSVSLVIVIKKKKKAFSSYSSQWIELE